MYTFADILDEESENLDIRAVSHRGFFAIINDLTHIIRQICLL